MVERVVPSLRGREGDPELLLDPLLADEVVEPLRSERPLGLLLLGPERGSEELAHAAALRRTRFTRSSGESSGSISASARSASTTV